MVSEFSIQPFRSQEEAQAYREGVGALPAQAAWMAGLMAPSSGISDYLGFYPEMPTEEQMIPTEQMPSFVENIANKQYLDAILQSAGVLGDAAYASIPLTGPYGAIAGTALKGIGAVGKASKGAKAKGLSSLPESEDYITAYHGTAADFDKFDIGKIGTGEGVQAFGRGLYFAEADEVGKNYKEALGAVIEYDGKPVWIGNEYVGTTGNEYFDTYLFERINRTGKDTGKWLGEVKETYKRAEDFGTIDEKMRYADELALLEENIDKIKIKDTGKLYEVKLKVTPDELLDLDKPLNEQNKAVKKKIDDLFEIPISSLNLDEGFVKSDFLEGLETIGDYIKELKAIKRSVPNPLPFSGASLTGELKGLIGAKKTSELLDSVGIKGNKYLDEFSRYSEVGDQTSNYVIFDDRVIDISKKYGVAIPVAGAMLLAQDQEMAAAQNDSLDL
tara:strand:- start:35 stop:1369 length:1335 start_codon:yes stop_codon:yes gene_type:complete